MTWAHGTPSGYLRHGCRCEKCSTARREYLAAWRRRNHKKMLAGHPVEHGTVNTYVNYECRCVPCTLANTVYQRAARDRKRKRDAIN